MDPSRPRTPVSGHHPAVDPGAAAMLHQAHQLAQARARRLGLPTPARVVVVVNEAGAALADVPPERHTAGGDR